MTLTNFQKYVHKPQSSKHEKSELFHSPGAGIPAMLSLSRDKNCYESIHACFFFANWKKLGGKERHKQTTCTSSKILCKLSLTVITQISVF